MSNVTDNSRLNLREHNDYASKQMDVEYEGGEKEESDHPNKKSSGTSNYNYSAN